MRFILWKVTAPRGIDTSRGSAVYASHVNATHGKKYVFSQMNSASYTRNTA